MWARLTNQFEMTASENKHFLMKCFYGYVYQQSHDVMSHIATIESMANQLSDNGSAP